MKCASMKDPYGLRYGERFYVGVCKETDVQVIACLTFTSKSDVEFMVI